jgi:hypothetical protein
MHKNDINYTLSKIYCCIQQYITLNFSNIIFFKSDGASSLVSVPISVPPTATKTSLSISGAGTDFGFNRPYLVDLSPQGNEGNTELYLKPSETVRILTPTSHSISNATVNPRPYGSRSETIPYDVLFNGSCAGGGIRVLNRNK